MLALASTPTSPGCKPSPGGVLGLTVMGTDSGKTLRPCLTRFSHGIRACTYESEHQALTELGDALGPAMAALREWASNLPAAAPAP